jgi:hypothetical protein
MNQFAEHVSQCTALGVVGFAPLMLQENKKGGESFSPPLVLLLTAFWLLPTV